MATQTSSKAPKIAVALILIVICGYYAYAQYAKFSTPLRPEPVAPAGEVATADGTVAAPAPGRPGGAPGEGGPREFAPPSPEVRAAMREQMFAELDLTPEQREKIEALGEPTPGEGMREHFQKVREILTPEQAEKATALREQHRDQMMQTMMSRRLEEARKTLPESEVKKLEEKMKERMEARRNGERPPWAPEGGGEGGRRGGRDGGGGGGER